MLTPDPFNGRRRCRSRHSRYRMAIECLSPNPPLETWAIRSAQIPDSAPKISTDKESSLIASRLSDIEPAAPRAFPTAGDSGSHGRQDTSEPHLSSKDRDVTVTLTWTIPKNFLYAGAVSLCDRAATPPGARRRAPAAPSNHPAAPPERRCRACLQGSSQPEEGLRHCILQAIPRRLTPWRNPLRAGAP